MLQVNKLQEDFRSSNSGIVHQNVHWHLETLSVRYLGWWKFCSTASNFTLASRNAQCGILHIDSQAQLRNGDRCGWLKAARTEYRWVHLAKIFAVTLWSMQSIEAVPLRSEAAQAFGKHVCMPVWHLCCHSLAFVFWLPATEMNGFQIAWKEQWHFCIILEQESHS